MKTLLVLLFATYCSAGHLGYSYVSPAVAAPAPAYYHPNVAYVGHHPVAAAAATIGYRHVPVAAAPVAVKTEVKAVVKPAPIPILRYAFDRLADGSFTYGFETGNGIQSRESGRIKNAGTENEAGSVEGSYSYTGDDGRVYTVTYVADETGFHATGDHLPTPPPIPEDILKSLEINAAEEAAAGVKGWQQ